MAGINQIYGRSNQGLGPLHGKTWTLALYVPIFLVGLLEKTLALFFPLPNLLRQESPGRILLFLQALVLPLR
jgi:hypothetical protein